jgi:hypothetical protein
MKAGRKPMDSISLLRPPLPKYRAFSIASLISLIAPLSRILQQTELPSLHSHPLHSKGRSRLANSCAPRRETAQDEGLACGEYRDGPAQAHNWRKLACQPVGIFADGPALESSDSTTGLRGGSATPRSTMRSGRRWHAAMHASRFSNQSAWLRRDDLGAVARQDATLQLPK